MAQDPVKVDAKHYTVEVENDKVRVLRIRYGPREKSVMHGAESGQGSAEASGEGEVSEG
jgi:hypothetical protein